MGDRGNIFFVDAELSDAHWGGLYMYTHWSGGQIVEVAQRALARGRSRWGDSQYLARILFCELIDGDVDGTTGFGLSTRIGDNEFPIVRVNDIDNTVALCEPGTEADRHASPLCSWSYAQFLEIKDFRPPLTEEQLLIAAREVLGRRGLELVTNEETGIFELYVVVVAKSRPVPPDEVDIAGLRAKGIEAEEGDELLFPIYYLPEHEQLAATHDGSMARLLGYPNNIYAAMGRALARIVAQ